MDEATRRIRVDVPDFHGRLDPYAFQDWITSLEDYFDWFNLAAERKVRFVKMKLKGQARVWWHSVEEQLHRLRQPPIADWEEMKLKLQENIFPLITKKPYLKSCCCCDKAILRLKIIPTSSTN